MVSPMLNVLLLRVGVLALGIVGSVTVKETVPPVRLLFPTREVKKKSLLHKLPQISYWRRETKIAAVGTYAVDAF